MTDLSTSSNNTAPLPTLPSAKPHRATALMLLGVSGLMFVAAIGLIGSAITIYHARGQQRIYQAESLAEMEQAAELRQREAQLSRGYDAPLWVNDRTYERGVTYEVSGYQQTEVPVLMGYELDTAVCIGTIGPDGFQQNPDHSLCLGY